MEKLEFTISFLTFTCQCKRSNNFMLTTLFNTGFFTALTCHIPYRTCQAYILNMNVLYGL